MFTPRPYFWFCFFLMATVATPAMSQQLPCPDGYELILSSHLGPAFWKEGVNAGPKPHKTCISETAPTMSHSSMGCPDGYRMFKEDIFLPQANRRVVAGKELPGYTCLTSISLRFRSMTPKDSREAASIYENDRSALNRSIQDASRELFDYAENRLEMAEVEQERLCALEKGANARLVEALSVLPPFEKQKRMAKHKKA